MSETIEVRAITPNDARGLSECLTRCYGETYFKSILYRPEETAALIEIGAYKGVVALSGGQLIGHIAINRPDKHSEVVEAGTTIVDDRYRGTGVMGRMAHVLSELVLTEGAFGFVHFPTTAHVLMQRASLASGGCETGILVGYIPAAMRDRTLGGPGNHRLCATVVYQPLVAAASRAIHVPARYRAKVAACAGHLGLQRTVELPRALPVGPTRLERAYDEARELEHFSISQ